ncbi:MAG TPA: hypothetical protein VEG27_02030 [Usitatibacter sp.]|nr:hypothetical protein [Usitatibacter sp.]
MSLLEFARGPALQAGIAIFVFGVTWRLLALLLLPRLRERSVARPGSPPAVWAGLREIGRRSLPWTGLPKASLFGTLNGYVFHLGIAIVVFGLAQHIVFIRGLFGVAWPNLSSNLVNAVAIVTVASMLAALARRIASPVLRLLSNVDDYLSWLLAFLPVITGVAAVAHLGARYETLLAAHILSVALFLAWFPFGKLMHAFLVFVTRAQTGAFFARRGAEA